MENKRIEDLVCELRILFCRIQIAFEQVKRLYTTWDYLGNDRSKVFRFLFLSDTMLSKIQKAARVLSFATYESEVINKILRGNVFDDAVVITKAVFHDIKPRVFDHFQEFLVAEFVNPNGRLLPKNEKGDCVHDPTSRAFASMGFNNIHLCTFDMNDSLVKKARDDKRFTVTHSCDEIISQMGFVPVYEYFENFKLHRTKEIVIDFGKSHICDCGIEFVFDFIPPEFLWKKHSQAFPQEADSVT